MQQPLEHIHTFTKGMNKDLSYSMLDSAMYTDAHNIRVSLANSGETGELTQIEGFSLIPTDFTGGIIYAGSVRTLSLVITKQGNVYRFYTLDMSDDTPVQRLIWTVTDTDGIALPISGEFSWEDTDNVKFYWADGQHLMRVINIDTAHADKLAQYDQLSDLDMYPTTTLQKPIAVAIDGGNMPSGVVQYAYAIITESGATTMLSPLSDLIHIASGDLGSNIANVTGLDQTERSTKAVQISITCDTNNYKYIRLYRIHYQTKNSGEPTVDIVNDIQLQGNGITYVDIGSSIGETTFEQLMADLSNVARPKVIGKADNILFAGDVTDEAYTPEYDARAYSCNESGTVLLKSTNPQLDLTFDITSIPSVPENHDCINPAVLNDDINSTAVTDDAYFYYAPVSRTGNAPLGGKGVNVSYRFAVTDLTGDQTGTTGSYINNDLNFSKTQRIVDSFKVKDVSNNTTVSIPVDVQRPIRFDYSDPEIDKHFKSYMRDEVYRFGIVLYNEKMVRSDVKWIADIRMPHMTETGYQVSDSKSIPYYSSQKEACVLHPLGLIFDVENLPADCVAYEIVRCDRQLLDRRILSQGIVSAVNKYRADSYKSGDMLDTMPFTTATPIPHAIGGVCVDASYRDKNDDTRSDANTWQMPVISGSYADYDYNIFQLITPDAAVNSKNVMDLVGQYDNVEFLNTMNSAFYRPVNSNVSTASGAKELPMLIAQDNSKQGLSIEWKMITGYGMPLVAVYSNTDFSGNDGELNMTSSLLKYYGQTQAENTKVPIDDLVFVDSIQPTFEAETDDSIPSADSDQKGIPSYGAYQIPIGGTTYVNCAAQLSYNMSVCSPKLMFHSDQFATEMYDRYSANLGVTDSHYTDVPLVNLRSKNIPYGGNNYATRQFSTYISTGSFHTKNDTTAITFGGDTYPCLFDYVYTAKAYNTAQAGAAAGGMYFCNLYLPVESSINLDLRTDAGQNTRNSVFDTDIQPTVSSMPNYFDQQKPLYGYNDAYSVNSAPLTYLQRTQYDTPNRRADARVMYSLAKTQNEVQDSWLQYKAGNYTDLDNTRGSVNGLVTTDDKSLYMLQESGIAVGQVNATALLSTDNNIGTLVLGSGTVLTNYQYITKTNGLKEGDLQGFVTVDGRVYVYDRNNSDLLQVTNQVASMGKQYGVQTYLNANNSTAVPRLKYDQKYNELLTSLNTETLVFSSPIGQFMSLFTYNPSWYLTKYNQLYPIVNDQLYQYNSGYSTSIPGGKIADITTVANANYTKTKVFDNVEYTGEFEPATRANTGNIPPSWSQLDFSTKHQTAQPITDNTTIDYRENTWRLAIPRSYNPTAQTLSMSYPDRLRGNYLTSKYTYDCSNGQTLNVPAITTKYRLSSL